MRILKKLLKVGGIIIVSLILFMIFLVVGATIFEDKLASFTMERLEDEINAPMSIGKVSINPLFSFPRLSAEINDFWIGDPNSKNSDTLFFINNFKIALNSWDLINGIYTMYKVEISGLDFDYIISKNGKSNIDFLLYAFVDTSREIPNKSIAIPLNLTANKFKLENIHVNYYDSLHLIGARVFIPEITFKAKTKNDIYSGKTEGSFVLSHCFFKETKLDEMESCTINFELEYEDNEAIINKLSINSEGLDLEVEGSFRLSDTLTTNAIIKANNLDFNILKKYIPKEYNHLYAETKIDQPEFITINLEMNYKDKNIDIKRLLIDNEGINFEVEGSINLKDTLTIDANIEDLSLDFDVLKKYIPNQYLEEYEIINFGGIVDISAQIKGKYADSTFLPLVNANLKFRNISLQTVDYPKIDTMNLTVHITNGEKLDLSEAAVKITSLEIVSPKSYVYLEGSIKGLINPQYNLSSNFDINLMEIENIIPDSVAQNLEGNISASITTRGVLPKIIPDDFVDYVLDKSTFSINFKKVSALLSDSLQVEDFSADINYSPQKSGAKKIQINKLNLKSEALNLHLQNTSLTVILSGKVSNPKTMSADLQSFRVQSGNSQIVGSGKVKNFETPEFDIKTSIILNLEELMVFVPDSLIKKMTGTIKANIQSKGKINLDSLDVLLFPILFENSIVDLTLNNITLAFPDSIMNIDNLSAKIGLKNDRLNIDDFSATYNGLKIEIDSSLVQNIYKAVLLNQKEELYIKTHIKLGDIFFDDFKQLMDLETTNKNIDTNIITEEQNWTFLIHGSASVNSFIIDSTAFKDFNINRLHINDMSALFKLTDSSYIVDQFKFKIFEGEMNNSLHYKVREDGTQSLSTHNLIQNMNIRTLLRDMDNFGMDSIITYENISGLFSTDLNTFVQIDDSILIDKMMVSGEITLEKGGVYNFSPAQEISNFTSIKELDNIQFKTLRSNIFMYKNKLYFPRTNIVSNALDIAAFGMQNLAGNSEYHLEVHLSNILFGKSKKRNKKQDKSGEEIDEKSLKKSSQKVRYTVTEGKSKVGRDTKDARVEMMNKIRVQKKMLDFIFFPKNIHYNTEPE